MVWGQVPIFQRVPLLGQIRKTGGKVVITGQHFPPSTIWAAPSLGAIGNGRSPRMSLPALPPCTLIRPRRYHRREQRSVFLAIPLHGKCRMGRCQIVDAGDGAPPGAIGAPVPPMPVPNHCPPGVSLPTLPPNALIETAGHLCRCQLPIAGGMPLFGQQGICRRQIIKARQNPAVCAEGTSISRKPVAHPCFPNMPAVASPPHPSIGVRRGLTWQQRRIFSV